MPAGNNIVLLARPNPLIIEHMKSFLERNGFQPHKVESPQELNSIPAYSVKGIVISTAILSSTEEGPVDVLMSYRKIYPKIPVIFSTLGNVEKTSRSLTFAAREKFIGATALAVTNETLHHEGLGMANIFLVVHKDDLNNSPQSPLLDQAVKKHFSGLTTGRR